MTHKNTRIHMIHRKGDKHMKKKVKDSSMQIAGQPNSYRKKFFCEKKADRLERQYQACEALYDNDYEMRKVISYVRTCYMLLQNTLEVNTKEAKKVDDVFDYIDEVEKMRLSKGAKDSLKKVLKQIAETYQYIYDELRKMDKDS